METSGVYFGSLKTFFLPAKLENIRIDTSLTYWLFRTLENTSRIDVLVYVTCFSEASQMFTYSFVYLFVYYNFGKNT